MSSEGVDKIYVQKLVTIQKLLQKSSDKYLTYDSYTVFGEVGVPDQSHYCFYDANFMNNNS